MPLNWYILAAVITLAGGILIGLALGAAIAKRRADRAAGKVRRPPDPWRDLPP